MKIKAKYDYVGLTKDKEYEVIKDNPETFLILNDIPKEQLYKKEHFNIPVKRIVKEKIPEVKVKNMNEKIAERLESYNKNTSKEA